MSETKSPAGKGKNTANKAKTTTNKTKKPTKEREGFTTKFGGHLKLNIKNSAKGDSIVLKIAKKTTNATNWTISTDAIIPTPGDGKITTWFDSLAKIVAKLLKHKNIYTESSYISFESRGTGDKWEFKSGMLYIPACKNIADFRIVLDNHLDKIIYEYEEGDRMGQTSLEPFKGGVIPGTPTPPVDMIFADYAVYACGYVGRLEEHVAEIEENLNDESEFMVEKTASVFCIIEDQKKAIELINDNKDEDDVIRTLLDNGMADDTICIKNPPNIFDTQSILQSYSHCACFGNPFEMRSFVTRGGRRVIWLHYDTESG